MHPLRFYAELWFAARKIPFQIGQKDLSAVIAVAHAEPDPRYASLSPRFISRAIRRVCRHPILMRDRRCLRMGVLGFRYLRKAGYDPEIRFGLDEAALQSDRITAHCWVCVDDIPVISNIEAGMVEIHRYRQTASSPSS